MRLKVKVTPEENKRIQEILSMMGYRLSYTDLPYLYVHNYRVIGSNICPIIFQISEYREVTPGYFEAFDTKLLKALNGCKE